MSDVTNNGNSGGPREKDTGVDTCDQCRARKVKCVPPRDLSEAGPSNADQVREGQICQSCQRRGEPCTYDYRYKKPGRPRGSFASKSSSTVNDRQSTTASPKRRRTPGRWVDRDPHEHPTPLLDGPTSRPGAISEAVTPTPYPSRTGFHSGPIGSSPGIVNGQSTTLDQGIFGPSYGSIFGSARLALDPPPALSFNYDIPYDPGSFTGNHDTGNGNTSLGAGGIDPSSLTLPPSGSTPSLTGINTLLPYFTTNNPTCDSNIHLSTDPNTPFPQIVSFATWEQVGFFLSLHMRHQHVLTPLVHQPTFARDLLHRRDIEDEAFRGLLMSIVSYTICQVPIHMLLGQMSRPDLESLCRRCQQASRAIQVRYQMRPNRVTLASTIFDWITSQAIGQDALRENITSDVRRLIYALGLHLPNPPNTTSSIDIEIGRRLFWEAYANDKTIALNGHPTSFPDYEGTPPLPLEVDDEYITPESISPQPTSRLSFMSGFIAISRIFKILSQAIIRQRTFAVSAPVSESERAALLDWIKETTTHLRQIMEDLPPLLRRDYSAEGEEAEGKETHSIYATQQANIQITALCLELYLLDFKASIAQGEDLVVNRKAIAEKAFKQLSTLPIDCIASNGESMRGKVLRVILALLDEDNSQQFSSELWDWWNMYSRVQFLQMIPERPNSMTAPQSPNHG